MKKTLIALVALAGVACADEIITLRYSMTGFRTDGEAPSNTAAAPGATAISKNANYVNWYNGQDISGVTTTLAKVSGAGKISITDASGIKAAGETVFSTETGFTMVFNAYTTNDWSDICSLTVGDTAYKFETNGGVGHQVKVYTPAEGGGVSEVSYVSNVMRETWYNLALTAQGGSYTFSVWDAEGNKVSSNTFTGAAGNLVDVTTISSFNAQSSGGYMNNFGLYDGVLSDAYLKELVVSEAAGKGMIQSVPEPATATLSLLALAGLASRRRRH